jgi:hypothetical protein
VGNPSGEAKYVSEQESYVYRPAGFRRQLALGSAWVGAGVLIAVAVMMLFYPNSLTPATRWERQLVAGMAVAGAAFLLFVKHLVVRHVRLVVRSSGLEYFQLGYRLRTGWENCIADGYSAYGALVGRGLLLGEPSAAGGRLSRWLARLNGQERFIPLSLFEPSWPAGELGRRVRENAPHLVLQGKGGGS